MINVILLNGPSSAGKSTLSKELQRRMAGKGVEAKIISIDDYMITDPKRPSMRMIFMILCRPCAKA